VIAHPYADRFPMLADEDLDRLAADIAQNGLQSPVVVDAEGRILDGRNRWAACERAGVAPSTVTFDGDDAAAFVLSANVSRRHLSTGQQAMSTALVLSDAGKRENGRWKRGSVLIHESVNSRAWNNLIAQAGAILDHAADLAEQVVAGTLALDAAYRQAETKRDAERNALAEVNRMQQEEDDARAHLAEVAPDYLTALDTGVYRSARQAFAAWEDDNRAEAATRRQAEATAKALQERQRKDLTLTYTSMATGLLSVGAYGHAPVADLMADFHPSLLHPVQLIRALSVENITDGITFLTALLNWMETQND
jgi:hypothetical protein